MKYCVEISEEQLRIISVAVDEYMRLRMGQFEPLTEDLVFDGEDKKQLYEKPYDIRVYNERKHCIETMFEAAYKPTVWTPGAATRFMGNVHRPCTRYRASAVVRCPRK